ncbi:MAG: TetR/AcrR family transcriptional regulator [Tissierellia bacterium]|nr:TetR/AcrR family transcriptional regulator [Tissierellia bacterium]
MAKVTNRKLQAQATYEKIYDAAMSLVEKKGFNNITVKDICEKAGVAVGSFYNYFNSKDDILNETFKKADNFFQDTVASNVDGENAKEKIVNFFIFYAEYCKRDKMDQLKQIYNTSNPMFIKKGRPMQEVLKKIVEEGIEKGEIVTDMNPDDLVRFLFIALRGVIFDWCLYDGGYDLIQFTRDYTERLTKCF